MTTTEQEREELVREGVAEWLAALPLASTELHDIKQPEWLLLYSIVADKFKQRDAQREAEIRVDEHDLWRMKWLKITSERELKAWSNERRKTLLSQGSPPESLANNNTASPKPGEKL